MAIEAEHWHGTLQRLAGAAMWIMTDRAIAMLDRLMCNHGRRQAWLMAVSASRLNRLL